MYNILLVDGRRNIGEDVNLQLIVEGYSEDELKVTTIAPKTAEQIIDFIGARRFDFALVEHAVLSNNITKKSFGSIKVYGYSATKEEPKNFDAESIPFMGYAKKSDEIINTIMECIKGKIPVLEEHPKEEKEPKIQVQEIEDDEYDTGEKNRKEEDIPTTENNHIIDPEIISAPEDIEKSINKQEKKSTLQEILDGDDDDTEYIAPKKRKSQAGESDQRKKETIKELAGERLRKEQVEQAKLQYDEESKTAQTRRKTFVISSFSGKGGVGKSTIAANIALYLSMIPHGRGTSRVCLVDYNVESGDVRSILGINSSNTHAMNEWSEEIHAQITRGRQAQDINYTATQMAPFLTPYKSKSTLSVLLAPQLHEDAQFIEGEHLQVMLRNIIDNGDFDFVVCDTADNTYDGTYCALSMSDLVLLICTQDVTTVNRNDSVMRSLQRSNIDLQKFRLVINNVSSKRKKGIGVDEIKKFYKDYECIGIVHEEDALTYANNNSTPLIYKPTHPFTKDLQPIVQYIIQDPEVRLEQPKQSGLLGIFKK